MKLEQQENRFWDYQWVTRILCLGKDVLLRELNISQLAVSMSAFSVLFVLFVNVSDRLRG